MITLVQPLPIPIPSRFLTTSHDITTKVKRTWVISPWIQAREEIWSLSGNPDTPILCAYNNSGHYVGDIKFAKYLAGRCIRPTVRSTGAGKVCCIGFSNPDKMWYGWSHRAILGFSIGDKLFEENYGDDYTLYSQHGTETITNLAEAKLAAEAFAAYVS